MTSVIRISIYLVKFVSNVTDVFKSNTFQYNYKYLFISLPDYLMVHGKYQSVVLMQQKINSSAMSIHLPKTVIWNMDYKLNFLLIQQINFFVS